MNPTSTRWARLAAAVVLAGWAGAAQGQVTYVGAGTAATATNADPAVVLPTGWAANDTCFLFAASMDNSAHSITTATGWAAVAQANNGATEHVSMWWKRLGATELDPTLTRSVTGAQLIARVVCYRGIDATSPYVASALNLTSNPANANMTVPTAAVNTTGLGPNAIVLHFVGSTSATNQVMTYPAQTGVPTGTTYSPGVATGGKQTTRTGLAMFSGLQATQGSTGTANTSVNSASQDGAVQLALRPAQVFTIGNGSADPAAGTILPAGSANNVLDTFTLQSALPVTVSAISVALTGNTAFTSVYLSKSATCSPALATVNSPTGTVSFSGLSESVTATQSADYYICGTVSAGLGTPTSVSANVTGVTHNGTGTWTTTDNDTGPTLTAQPQTSITIGNGSAEPGNSTINAGQVGPIDAFSVQTNSGTATITAVTVNLTAGATALTDLFVNSNATCTGTTYGTLASPVVGNNTVTLTTNISATTTSGTTNLYVCGTAATVGANTAVTGNVSSVTATGYTSTDNDTTNSTLTVAPPPANSVTIGNGSAEPGNSTINVGQVGPIDAFSVQTNTGTATITAVAVNVTAGATALTNLFINSNATCTGTTYGTLASPVVGNNTVTLTTNISATTTSGTTNLYVCGTAATVASNTAVTGNVSSVTATGYTSTDNDTTNSTLTVAPPPVNTVTIGNGSAEPGNSTINAGQVGPIDAFSVQTNSGTATITAVTVNLTAGATALTNLFVNSNATCTGTTYGTLASPVVGNNIVTLTTNISATTTSGTTNLYVCGTAATVASNTAVTGNVSSVTATGYTSTDNDTTNATLTVAPPPTNTVTIGNGSAEPGNSAINVGQVGPIDAFSVQTNSGTATITAVTVNLTAGATALTNLFVNSNATCTGTTYGTLASPVVGNNTVALTTNISATTTSGTTNLYVCGTAATVASNTAVTGNVSSVTATGYTSTDNDTTNATLTVMPTATVTIGNGSAEPSNSTIRSGQVGPIDAFSVQTNTGTATITAVVVNLTAGNTALANLFINSNATCTGTTYGTLASPVLGNNTVSLATNISATTTSGTTNLYVCGTAASVSTSTAITGNVASVTSAGYVSADSDTTNATLTVAANVTIGNGSAEPSNSAITVGQVGPIDAFSVQTDGGFAVITAVVVNLTAGNAALSSLSINTTATCTGTTYGSLASPVLGNNTISLSSTIGANTTSGTLNIYVCGTGAAVAASTAVTGNVSSVTAAGFTSTDSDTTNATLTVTPNLAIGNGSSEPANSSITSGQVGAIDAFTVQTSAGTATITAVTVNLTYGNTGLTNLFINSAAACNGTTYGTLASPVYGNNTITLTTNISATTTSGTTHRYVCGTAASVASNTDVVGTVASVTAAGYTSTDGDTTSAVLTVTPSLLGTTTGAVTATANSCTQITAYASYTGDSDGNATVSFLRSTDGNTFGGLAACTGLTGATSPRACVDATVAASTAYWYRAQFTDTTGGVSGGNPVTMLYSVTTPACPGHLVLTNPGAQPAAVPLTVGAATWTYVGQLSLAASAGTLYLSSLAIVNGATAPQATGGDLQLNLTNTAGTSVYSTGSWDGAKWVFGSIADPTTGTPIAIGTAATTFRIYATANYGAAASERFAMTVDPANITAVAPATATTGTAFTASTFTTAAPGTVDEGSPTNTTAALVSIVNPARGNVVSGNFLVQIYVYSSNGSAIAAMGLSTNGTAPTCAANDATITKTSHTYSSPAAAMYSKVVSGLAAGTYTLKACARNGTGVSMVSAPVTVTVRAAGTGDGALLVRDNSSQLCSDCHDQNKLKPHSSESTRSSRGLWSTSCRDCHTPHNTRNIFLVGEQIVPPSAAGTYQPVRDVRIATTVGDSRINGTASPAQSSFVNTDNSGPCQVCHTRTTGPLGRRWQQGGNDDTAHYAGAGTQPCTGCHSHKDGFAAGESGGGSDCDSCHGDIFTPMNTTSGSYHHYMNNAWSGNAAGSGTTTYPIVAWGATTDTNRRCLTCHVDHNIFRADVNPSGGRAKNLRTAYNLAPTTTTNFTNTDFDNALAGGGLCLSCHTTSQTKSYTQPDGTTSTPIIDKAGYNASIHNYNASAGFKDSTTFNGNCAKCHTDTMAKARQTSTAPNQFGLHDSSLRRISNPISDVIVTGTATGAQTVNGVVDTGKTWTAGQYDGWNVTISDTNGTRSNVVVQTAATTLTVETPWAIAPVAGTTKYTIGEPAEERQCKQCHSGGVAGNDPFNGRPMSQEARRFDQYLRVYGSGTIAMSGTTLTGTGTSWYYSGSASFVKDSSTVTLTAPLANVSSLIGWSIKGVITADQPRWYTIVAATDTQHVVISPPYAEANFSGTYTIAIGDWYVKCDADTTGIWYRIMDVTSGTAATIYPGYGGAACSGSTYVARSSPGHPMAITAGLHKPGESTASGWNPKTARHVTCADCHDPHKAMAGNHTPGATTTANLGAVSTGTWGVTPTYTSRNATGGSFVNNATSVTTTTAGTFTAADVNKNIIAPDGSVLAIKAYVSGTQVTTTRYSGPNQSGAAFRIGDPIAAPTYAPVTNMTTANAQYQLCFKCHSSHGYSATPPNTYYFAVSTTATAATVPQTDTGDDFNPFQFATHAILEKGHNQPPATANANWASSAGRKQSAPNTGLDNTFVNGWGAQSIVTCTDCHLSDSGEDPWGPHGSANPWLLRGIDPNVTVTIANGTVVYPNICYYKGASAAAGGGVPNTGDRKNLCLNCHRADVYGMVSSGGSGSGSSCNGGTTLTGAIPYQNLSRVNHPVDGRQHSNSVSAGALTRWGIYCMQCHGGASIGAIHGTNEGYGTGGNSGSYRGKRFLNGATWSGHTRAAVGTPVGCTTKDGRAADSVNTCSDGVRATTGNSANYDYESGAD